MAQLDKNAYYGKMIYAGKKMAKNKEIETLTEEQHDALSQMCSARHELHTNMDRITKGTEQDYLGDIIEANGALEKSGLPIISTEKLHHEIMKTNGRSGMMRNITAFMRSWKN